MPLVDADWQGLARARIAARRDAEGLQYLINTVPASLKGDPASPSSATSTGSTRAAGRRPRTTSWRPPARPTRSGGPTCGWSGGPTSPGRRCEDGDVAAAYRIAAQSFGTSGADYADSEWVAGFVALTRMGDPERAVGHFRRFRAVVVTPISLGRAGYWLGLAYERAGDEAAAGRVPRRRRGTRRASTASSPPRSWPPARRPARRRRHAAGVARRRSCTPGGAGGAASSTRRRRAPRLAVLAPRRRAPAAGDPRRAGADGDRPRAAGDRHPHRQGRGRRRHHAPRASTIRCTRSPAATGRCRPNSPWRSPGRNRSSTPPPPAAPARAA